MQYRTINGVDVFDVGASQFAGWCCERYSFGHGRIRRNDAEILKGRYALVSCSVRFGRVFSLDVVSTYDTLRAAVRTARNYIDAEGLLGVGCITYVHEYEVWHIVDDCELYDEWCARAADSRQDDDIEWVLVNIAKTGAPECALCGDSWGGPWVVRGGVTSGRYWLCEDCDEKVSKIMGNYATSGAIVYV